MEKEQMYSIIADYFIALSDEVGDCMTNLRLQKLVYYAQAWYLANFKEHLFKEDFEAWIHGPVLPDLYHTYKERRGQPIIKDIRLKDVKKRLGANVIEFLEEIAEVYMPFTAFQLEAMTHRDAPWIKARGKLPQFAPSNEIISKDSMIKFYGEKIKVE